MVSGFIFALFWGWWIGTQIRGVKDPDFVKVGILLSVAGAIIVSQLLQRAGAP